MIQSLDHAERQTGLLLAVLVAAMGVAMAVLARGQGVMAFHGALAAALGGFLAFALAGSLHAAAPDGERALRYYDEPTRFGIVMTLIWAMIGMGVGVWVAALLYWPEATFMVPWASFGRLRPVHTTAIIFGFGGNALIATSFHVLQRT